MEPIAATAIWVASCGSIRSIDARNAHCSSSGIDSKLSSRNIELPTCRGPCCKGNAIKLPKPPRGMVSWLGNSRSYESMPSSGRSVMVSVSRWQAICRAIDAAIGAEKKNQTCAPLPDLERSTTAGRPYLRAVVVKARASSAQLPLSKSTATNQQVSSTSIA